MKNIIQCFTGPLLVLAVVLISFATIGLQSAPQIDHLLTVFVDPFAYCCYAFAFGIMISHTKPYETPLQKKHLSLFFVLFFCALLREMGIQHWLTTTDTTAFKLRFFTNPANPIHEKIISATLLITVALIVLYLLIYYVPKIIKGFFEMKPLYWTVATFGGTGIICKIADRLPANLRHAGMELSPQTTAWIKLFEETTELCLPLLCALAFVQFAHACPETKNKKAPR